MSRPSFGRWKRCYLSLYLSLSNSFLVLSSRRRRRKKITKWNAPSNLSGNWKRMCTTQAVHQQQDFHGKHEEGDITLESRTKEGLPTFIGFQKKRTFDERGRGRRKREDVMFTLYILSFLLMLSVSLPSSPVILLLPSDRLAVLSCVWVKRRSVLCLSYMYFSAACFPSLFLWCQQRNNLSVTHSALYVSQSTSCLDSSLSLPCPSFSLKKPSQTCQSQLSTCFTPC